MDSTSNCTKSLVQVFKAIAIRGTTNRTSKRKKKLKLGNHYNNQQKTPTFIIQYQSYQSVQIQNSSIQRT